MAVQSRAGHDAIGFRIEVNEDDDFLSDAHWHLLFAERKQQVLLQPPIQEGANTEVDAHDFQEGELADRRVRNLRWSRPERSSESR